MATTTWFNRMRAGMSTTGIEGHKCDPIPVGKTWETGVCVHCNSPFGVTFRSRTDAHTEFVLCKRCGKFSHRQKVTK